MNAINLYPFNTSITERKLSNMNVYQLRGETLSRGETPQLRCRLPRQERSRGLTCTRATLSDLVHKHARHVTSFLPAAAGSVFSTEKWAQGGPSWKGAEDLRHTESGAPGRQELPSSSGVAREQVRWPGVQLNENFGLGPLLSTLSCPAPVGPLPECLRQTSASRKRPENMGLSSEHAPQ